MSRYTHLWLCLALVGCEAGDEGAASAPEVAAPDAGGERDASVDELAPEHRTPTPYLPELEGESLEAALETSQIEEAVAAHVPALAAVDLSAVPALIDELVDLTAPGCPGGQRVDTGDGYFIEAGNECVTEDGVRFSGYLNRRHFDQPGGEGIGFAMELGSVRIEAPDGRRFEGVGYLDVRSNREGDGQSWGTFTSGYVRVDEGRAGGDPWLSGALQGRLERWVFRHESGEMVMGLSAATSMTGELISALVVEDLQINTWLCEDEPRGVISAREPAGPWHDVIFDGFDEDAEAPTERCDGCGLHLFGGDEAGAVCGTGSWLGAVRAGASR